MDKTNENYGNIKVENDVIAKIAAEATLETTGVAGLCEGLTDALTKTILHSESYKKAIRLTEEDGGYIIDVLVIVMYAVRIPEVAWNIQRNVKREVEAMTGQSVKAVNIHIQEVYFPEGEENENDKN